MDKKSLISISKTIRDKKDRFKKKVAAGSLSNQITATKVIIPKQIFEPSAALLSDKWVFNGFVIKLEESLIVVDPGVDFYSRFLSTGFSTTDISGLVLSHDHIDHSASINIFLDQILRNSHKKTDVILTKIAFESVVTKYYKERVLKAKNINFVLLDERAKKLSYKICKNYTIDFIPLFHTSSQTFGFKLRLKDSKIGYLADTGYAIRVKTSKGIFDSDSELEDIISIEEKHNFIKSFYSDVTSVIANLNDLYYNRHTKYHLSGWDILDIFEGSSLKNLILHHIPTVNIDGEDSNYLYKMFFSDQPYDVFLPHHAGREIVL